MERREEEQIWTIIWGFSVASLLGDSSAACQEKGKRGANRLQKDEEDWGKTSLQRWLKIVCGSALVPEGHICAASKCARLQMRKRSRSSRANYKRTGPKPHQYHQGRAVQSGTGCWRNDCSTRSASSHHRRSYLISLNTQVWGFWCQVFLLSH